LTRYWHTLPREDRFALLDVFVEMGFLTNDYAVTPLGEQYIKSIREQSPITDDEEQPVEE